jgi:DNA primase
MNKNSFSLDAVIEKTQARIDRVEKTWYLGRCPFHDDEHPSLYFNEDEFKCMACGENGDLAKLSTKLSSLETQS